MDIRSSLMLAAKFPPAYNTLGGIYLKKGRYDLALAQFKPAMVLDPQNLTALLGTARSLEGMELYQKAEQYYSRVLKLDYKNEPAKQGLKRVQGKR